MNKLVVNKILLLFCALLLTVMVGCQNGTGNTANQNNNAGQNTNSNDSGQNNDGKEVLIRFGHHDAEIDYEKNIYYAYSKVFKESVEEKSQGRIRVDLFPNSQLGDLRSMVEQVSRGDFEMVGGADLGLLAMYTPAVETLSIPYAFKSAEIAQKVMDGKFGNELAEEIKQKSNLKMLSYLPTAMRNFSNNVREVKTLEDMKGLKIRTQEIPIHLEMVKALGANPTIITFEELYSSLQVGAVDGQENAPYTMINANLHEVTKYYTLDGHLVNTATIMMNDKFFNSLSPEDQEIVQNAADEAKKELIRLVNVREANDLKLFEEKGITITTLSPEELQKFEEAAKEPVLNVLKGKVNSVWIDKLFASIKEAEQ